MCFRRAFLMVLPGAGGLLRSQGRPFSHSYIHLKFAGCVNCRGIVSQERSFLLSLSQFRSSRAAGAHSARKQHFSATWATLALLAKGECSLGSARLWMSFLFICSLSSHSEKSSSLSALVCSIFRIYVSISFGLGTRSILPPPSNTRLVIAPAP